MANGPFPEGEVGGDDDRRALVELADQVELEGIVAPAGRTSPGNELPAGLREGQVSELVQDQEVEAGDQLGGSALAFSARFGVELFTRSTTLKKRPRRP